MIYLEMNHVKKSFGDLEVLKDISLKVEDAKAVFVADKENIITGELLYRPDFQESEEGVAFSEVVVKQTADVEEYFKNLIRFEGYKVIPEEYDESDMLMHYDELSIQANKLLFLERREK